MNEDLDQVLNPGGRLLEDVSLDQFYNHISTLLFDQLCLETSLPIPFPTA
jgi:hypothetical protein